MLTSRNPRVLASSRPSRAGPPNRAERPSPATPPATRQRYVLDPRIGCASSLHRTRCGVLFDTGARFTTVNVEDVTRDARETVTQVLLCGACADAVGDALTLETTTHEHP